MPLALIHSDVYLSMRNFVDLKELSLEMKETGFYIIVTHVYTGIKIKLKISAIKHESPEELHNFLVEFSECPEYYQGFFEDAE